MFIFCVYAIAHNLRINLNKTTKGILTCRSRLGRRLQTAKRKIRGNTEIWLNSDKKDAKPRFYMRVSDTKNSNYKFSKNNKTCETMMKLLATSKQSNQNR